MSLEAFPAHFRTTFAELVGTRILVALSGGGDSVALLHLLRDGSLGLDLEAAHVHHGARGAEADADARFCRDLCASLGIPFHLLRLNPPPPGRGSLEAWWRRERYRTLLDLRKRIGAAAVATGHNRDDVAEGVLVQLLRGAGPRALAGIHTATREGLIRPLLPWTREEIRSWLASRKYPWREDSSNADPGHLRNRVRHRILPVLEEAAPAVRRHLERLARDLAADEAAFAGELVRLDAWIEPYAPDGGVPVERLEPLPHALKVRWLHAQAARAGIGPVTRRQGELALELLSSGKPRSVALAGRWRLRRAGGRLWLEPPRPLPEYRFPLAPGEGVELPIPGWRVRAVTSGTAAGKTWRSPPLPARGLTIRSIRPGDRLEGVRVVKRLGSLPRHLRAAWPIVCCGDTIVWVPGLEATALPRGTVIVEVEHP